MRWNEKFFRKVPWAVLWVGALCVVLCAGGCMPVQNTGTDYPGRSIGVLEVSGPEVYVDGRPARTGDTVREGMKVYTGSGSSARIRFTDEGYCQLDENTDPWFRIDIDPITQRKCLYIEIGIGRVYVYKHDVCFYTPDVAGVLNSRANFRVNPEGTALALFEGEARLERPAGLTLFPQQLAVFSKGQVIDGPRMMSEEERRSIPAWLDRFRFGGNGGFIPDTTGWCCAGGKIFEASRKDCERRRGFFSFDHDEAQRRCQPQGWCCLRGQVFPSSPQECERRQGFFSFDREDAQRHCQPQGWCCLKGQVFPSSPQDCERRQGFFSFDHDEAQRRCQPQGWCCLKGQVFPSFPQDCERRQGFFSFDREEAQRRCQPQGWCCKGGRVFESSPEKCKQMGGFFSRDRNEARERCRPRLE